MEHGIVSIEHSWNYQYHETRQKNSVLEFCTYSIRHIAYVVSSQQRKEKDTAYITDHLLFQLRLCKKNVEADKGEKKTKSEWWGIEKLEVGTYRISSCWLAGWLLLISKPIQSNQIPCNVMYNARCTMYVIGIHIIRRGIPSSKSNLQPQPHITSQQQEKERKKEDGKRVNKHSFLFCLALFSSSSLKTCFHVCKFGNFSHPSFQVLLLRIQNPGIREKRPISSSIFQRVNSEQGKWCRI